MVKRHVLLTVLCLLLTLTVALPSAAGGVTGAQYFGVEYQRGELAYIPGITLDFEIRPGLLLTLDVQSRYVDKQFTTRYDLGLNYYPGSILNGYLLSLGGVMAHDQSLYWYIEVARPFD